jgi:hypothetical protein
VAWQDEDYYYSGRPDIEEIAVMGMPDEKWRAS